MSANSHCFANIANSYCFANSHCCANSDSLFGVQPDFINVDIRAVRISALKMLCKKIVQKYMNVKKNVYTPDNFAHSQNILRLRTTH